MTRPSKGAAIDFWIKNAAGESVSISIADTQGFELRSLSVVARRGVNRIVWDLQADAKHRFGGPDQDWPGGQIDYVPAGDYEISVKVGEESAKTTVTVHAAPAWGSPETGGS